jgi:hypothetical protein
MPWGVVAAAVVGGVATNEAAKKGAKATKKASDQATALSREQFERGIEEVAPFKQIGVGALPALSTAANQQVDQFNYRDPNQFLSSYFNSGEYQALNKQATDQILRNRSVTGGLRSGGSSVDLANIAPTLGINALNRVNQQDLQRFGVNQGAKTDQFNRLFGVASMGANAASGNQVAGANFASQAGANAITAGNAQNMAYQQQGKAAQGLATDLGSIYLGNRMGYFDKQNEGKI